MEMLKSILEEGVVLLCVGMGVVYLFLSLMVWMTMLSSKVSAWLGKFFPEAEPEVKASRKPAAGGDDAVIAAAIAIAKAQN
jgi:sodium pump decarboxylase gamma subunit